jgi:hypothetical protein
MNGDSSGGTTCISVANLLRDEAKHMEGSHSYEYFFTSPLYPQTDLAMGKNGRTHSL